MRKIISLVMIVSLVLVTSISYAAPKGQNEMMTQGPRRHLGTIVLAGIAGAILGLSTLSFYGRPQDKLSNIAVGAAIGIIGGTMYTTYKAAAEPKDFYGLRATGEAETWALLDNDRKEELSTDIPPRFNYSFSF